MTPETCPNCGADVPPRARACSECGACEETGWSEQADVAYADIPDDSFDYNEFVKREFGPKKVLPRGINWFWWAVSIAIATLLAWLAFR
jgi:hypothetical protein